MLFCADGPDCSGQKRLGSYATKLFLSQPSEFWCLIWREWSIDAGCRASLVSVKQLGHNLVWPDCVPFDVGAIRSLTAIPTKSARESAFIFA